MHIVKMLVTFVVIIVGDHLVGVAFEAHTFVATTASDTIATIDTNKRHFTSLVRTCSYTILFHVLLEDLIVVTFGLLTCHIRMMWTLRYSFIYTLHFKQYEFPHTSQRIESAIIALICLHPAVKQNVRI